MRMGRVVCSWSSVCTSAGDLGEPLSNASGDGVVVVTLAVSAACVVALEKNDLFDSLPVPPVDGLGDGWAGVGVDGRGWNVERNGCFSAVSVIFAAYPPRRRRGGTVRMEDHSDWMHIYTEARAEQTARQQQSHIRWIPTRTGDLQRLDVHTTYPHACLGAWRAGSGRAPHAWPCSPVPRAHLHLQLQLQQYLELQLLVHEHGPVLPRPVGHERVVGHDPRRLPPHRLVQLVSRATLFRVQQLPSASGSPANLSERHSLSHPLTQSVLPCSLAASSSTPINRLAIPLR